MILTLLTGQFQRLTPQNQLVVHVGDSASFTCTVTSSTDSARNITWTINGLQLVENSDVMEIFNPDIAGGIGQITINNVSLPYNGSEVNCLIHFNSGTVATSNPSVLIVLGMFLSRHRDTELRDIISAKNTALLTTCDL